MKLKYKPLKRKVYHEIEGVFYTNKNPLSRVKDRVWMHCHGPIFRLTSKISSSVFNNTFSEIKSIRTNETKI